MPPTTSPTPPWPNGRSSCSRPAELGGPLGDVGSHCLYMAEHLIGSRIRSLACTYLLATLGLAVENGAFVQ